MKRKILTQILVLLTIAVLVITGCATPTPREDKPIELRFTSGAPFFAGLGKVALAPWAKELEERSAAIGKPVKVTLYSLGSLAAFPDTYDAIIKGIADIGAPWGPSHFPGRMPLLEVLQLPMLFPSGIVASQVAQELYDTRPEIQEELKEAKLLFFCSSPPVVIHCKTRQIEILEDMEGMKITTRPGYTSFTVEKLGGVPVTITPPEAYQALERGVVDSVTMNWDGSMVFKYHEVTKYRTETPMSLYSDPLACSISIDTYNKLPQEVQEIIDEISGMPQSIIAGKAFDESCNEVKNTVMGIDKKAGNPPPYMITDDESQKWIEAITPLYDQWIEEVEAKGLPGRSIFEDVKRLTEKYSK